ncbi:hypothetical protein SAMN05216235_1821, partial [Salinicoccus halodurans]
VHMRGYVAFVGDDDVHMRGYAAFVEDDDVHMIDYAVIAQANGGQKSVFTDLYLYNQ